MGAGGISAALTVKLEVVDGLLVEKRNRAGGSTAVSGGAVWLPLNSKAAQAGHPDTFDNVWEYLSRTVGDAAPDHMKRAFLENGPKMLDYMAERGVLDLVVRTYSPDYYPDRTGAWMVGHALDPASFAGNKLGKN